jgi:L-alanine-DL-glutamate epimerase-like enolase superfamily enzyme
MKITQFATRIIRHAAPTKGRVSLTHPTPVESSDLVAVTITVEGGRTGLGFTTSGVGSTVLQHLIDHDLAPLLVGENATQHERLYARAHGKFRSVGWGGLVARAYAAIDIALWDLKAKCADLPLAELLGGMRASTPCFLGDVAPAHADVGQALKMARPMLEQGVLGVAVEVGSGDVNADADRVQQMRDGLGEAAWLGIGVEGRYDLATAMALAHFYEDDVGIDWIDTPIAPSDHVGYQRLAERMEVPLAVGSQLSDREAFKTILEQGNVRVLRPDVLRMGGITPFVKLAALAEAYHVTLVPYRLPEIGVHLACGLPNVPMVEHGAWFSNAFETTARFMDGKMQPPPDAGHGWRLKE